MKVVREFFHTKETKKAKNYHSVSDAIHAAPAANKWVWSPSQVSVLTIDTKSA